VLENVGQVKEVPADVVACFKKEMDFVDAPVAVSENVLVGYQVRRGVDGPRILTVVLHPGLLQG
jgi:hypothetical protein